MAAHVQKYAEFAYWVTSNARPLLCPLLCPLVWHHKILCYHDTLKSQNSLLPRHLKITKFSVAMTPWNHKILCCHDTLKSQNALLPWHLKITKFSVAMTPWNQTLDILCVPVDSLTWQATSNMTSRSSLIPFPLPLQLTATLCITCAGVCVCVGGGDCVFGFKCAT